MSHPRRHPRPARRGAALLTVLILIAILTGATLAMVNLATGDTEIAAAGRMDAVSFSVAESALDEVLTDQRTALEANPLVPGIGYAPSPDHPTLQERYPDAVSFIEPPPADGPRAEAFVRYVRNGPVQESSALVVRSIVYEIAVTGDYRTTPGSPPLARREVAAEFYRFAPRPQGIVSRTRHFQ